jgi:hypothetical protein
LEVTTLPVTRLTVVFKLPESGPLRSELVACLHPLKLTTTVGSAGLDRDLTMVLVGKIGGRAILHKKFQTIIYYSLESRIKWIHLLKFVYF